VTRGSEKAAALYAQLKSSEIFFENFNFPVCRNYKLFVLSSGESRCQNLDVQAYYCTLLISACSSTEQLVDSPEESDQGVELDDVGAANTQLNAILRDETWVKNAA